MSTIHKAGFDVNGFAGTWDRHGRYIPRVGETFTVAEWRRYKHPGANGGQPDGSWKGEPFRCIEVKRAFDCSCCGLVSVVGQALPNYDFQIGSPFLSRIEFNIDIVRLEPSTPKFPEHRPSKPLDIRIHARCSCPFVGHHPLCSLNPLARENSRLREENAESQREIERLRSQLGHANSRLASQDSRIRTLDNRACKAQRALEGY